MAVAYFWQSCAQRRPHSRACSVYSAGITSYDDLPAAAKDYVRFIEDEAECAISIISTGPRREETIIR